MSSIMYKHRTNISYGETSYSFGSINRNYAAKSKPSCSCCLYAGFDISNLTFSLNERTNQRNRASLYATFALVNAVSRDVNRNDNF